MDYDTHTIRNAFNKSPDSLMEDTVGTGAFARVHATYDPRYVVKRFNNKDAWSVWAGYAASAYRSRRGNACLPRVIALQMPADGTDSYAYALMERIPRTLRRMHSSADCAVACYIQDKFTHIRAGVSVMTEAAYTGTVVAPLVLGGKDVQYIVRHLHSVVIDCTSSGVYLQEDMHMDNIMERADTSVVVTDPFSSSGCHHCTYKSSQPVRELARRYGKACNVTDPGFYSEYSFTRNVT
jgi:hypothetical protein